MEHQQEKDNSLLPEAPALVTSIETGGLKFRRAPSNSRPSGGKPTFISAELAYSQDQRRLFDKIGYNKVANQETKQRDLIEKHSQLRQHTAGKNQRAKVIKKGHTERENQSPGGYAAKLESPMIIQNQFVDDARFTRGCGKLDESFYESKVNNLSKTRAQRQQILEDITNVSMRQPCQSANVMNRLINMRKLKETESASLDTDSLQESSQAEEVYPQQNNRRQPNFQQLYRIGEEKVRDLSGDRYFNQKRDSKSQCSQLPQTLISTLNGSSITIQQDHQRTSGSEGRIGTQNLEQQQQFMTRRNNLVKCNFLTTEILPETSNKAKTSKNSRDQTKLLSKRKLAAFSNEQTEQAFVNPMILRNDHRIEAFFPVEYDVNYTCLAAAGQDLSGDQRSVISRGDYCLSSTKKLQPNRIMNQMSQLQFIPIIKGINRQHLLDLFQAKCQDLKITSSRDQMLRFFEVITRNQGLKERKLNLAEQGFGNHSMRVIAKIIKNNEQFSSLDLHKNSIGNEGIRYLAKALMQNDTLVHLDIGCNQVGTEGAIFLFEALKYHPSLISLKLANSDCYKNKNKIGLKGAAALGDLLETNHMIQFVDLTDNSLSQDSLQHIIYGVRSNPNLVSLNLSQNDIGSSTLSTSPFNNLLGIFDPSHDNPDVVCCASLEELVLSSNTLTNHHLAEFASLIRNCSKTKLRRLDLSHNRLSVRGLLTMLQALRQNSKMHITHLYMDKLNLDMGSAPEKVSNFYALQKLFSEYLRINKSLKVVSMNNCSINNEMMAAIGRGLQMNDQLETLSVKHNMIGDDGMIEAIKAFQENKQLKIKTLDLSSNKISDACGVQLASALQNVSTLEQLFLRDNDLSNEAGDALFFLVQSQKKLCRVQVDMNTIRYGTLVDIERECKRNRKNLVGRQICELMKVCNEGGSSDFKQGATQSTEHTPLLKDANILTTALDQQITDQHRLIQLGQQRVILQEEKVLEYLSEGSREVQVFEQQVRELELVKEQLDSRLARMDQELVLRGKEQGRKVEQEVSLLERCREYLASQQEAVDLERQRLAERTRIRRVNDDVIKLQGELEKALRDQRLMGMIAENYVKEINRRRQNADETKPKTPEGSGRIAQSANQVLFFNKKQQALFQHHYASGNESMMLYEDSHGDLKKPSPNSSNHPNTASSKNGHSKNPLNTSTGQMKKKKSTSVKRKKSNKRQ